MIVTWFIPMKNLSGDMKRYGEVEEFLHFLKISTGAHFSVKNKTIVVSIK